jgi:hypothetical protein
VGAPSPLPACLFCSFSAIICSAVFSGGLLPPRPPVLRLMLTCFGLLPLFFLSSLLYALRLCVNRAFYRFSSCQQSFQIYIMRNSRISGRIFIFFFMQTLLIRPDENHGANFVFVGQNLYWRFSGKLKNRQTGSPTPRLTAVRYAYV